MVSPQIIGILVFPRVGCPALPRSKTYHLSKSRILDSNKDQVSIGMRATTFILGSNQDPENGHRRSGKKERKF